MAAGSGRGVVRRSSGRAESGLEARRDHPAAGDRAVRCRAVRRHRDPRRCRGGAPRRLPPHPLRRRTPGRRRAGRESADDRRQRPGDGGRIRSGSFADPPGGRGRASRPGGITLPPGVGRFVVGRFVATEILDLDEAAVATPRRTTAPRRRMAAPGPAGRRRGTRGDATGAVSGGVRRRSARDSGSGKRARARSGASASARAGRIPPTRSGREDLPHRRPPHPPRWLVPAHRPGGGPWRSGSRWPGGSSPPESPTRPQW